MTRSGPPDEPNYYSEYSGDEPIAYSNYANHGGYGEPPEPPTPWYRKPAALVAFGALGAVILALAI